MERELQRIAEIGMIALTIWREARGESRDTKIAVGQVIMERAKRPRWWGDSILSVLAKPLQFSSLTDPKDRQLVKWPATTEDRWYVECLEVARSVYDGTSPIKFPGADSYHDISISQPKWATKSRFCGQSGRIMFYQVEE